MVSFEPLLVSLRESGLMETPCDVSPTPSIEQRETTKDHRVREDAGSCICERDRKSRTGDGRWS